ncbi:GNAT family N-acetyltransferase [Alkaliphilus hydrothermalis]|uniref:RimJ/RimL family protein N-acetyltransferase n=1 Tax=Alkaliphilus hydrothermalis TaxID=1482730 RepID=A0ABS2NMN7_9FIRM|nr:GNAT family N-acetyltransferase [Alkaliphilus hydrothermalis]MBM7614136.1 RimJ/RimL family protein N-acetyltransferase [Alkaliphilus hydrothermalis]
MQNFKIETDRLVITKFDESMAEIVHLNSLDVYNRKFVPDEVFETIEEARGAILFLMSCYDGENKGPLVYPIILKSGENIGYVQAVPLKDGEWEIGYHIAENYTGNDYATEAVMAFAPVIANQLGITHIWGISRGDNLASCKVLEKCSFNLQDKSI